ncbi:ATP-binding protein [Blautia schinkii]|nr:ATP-binding protein [Blautia schinkii]
MTPNGIFEMLSIRAWMIYEEFRFRDIRKNPRWLIAVMAFVPFVSDMVVYYTSVHPEIFSPYAQAGIKVLGTTVIVLSRFPMYETGAFSTLASMAIFDFCMGIAITLRYFIFSFLGISLAAYTPDEFRVVPILGLVLPLCLVQLTIIPWLRKFRRAMNYPGPALKTMVFFYWAPSLIMVRPMDVLDFSDSTVIVISSITSLAVLGFGWLYLIGRRRQIRLENHYLAMQAELFAEHDQMLKEQAEFMKKCKDCLQKIDANVPGMTFPDESVVCQSGGYSKNQLLDTAIETKVEQGRSTGIPITLEMKDLELPQGVPEIHFLTIFYNLFDNGLEAAGQCSVQERYLIVTAYTDGQGLYLTIENSASSDWPRGHFATTKKDKRNHGLGLKIVRDIVKKDHGRIYIKEEDSRFTAEIFLPAIKNT